MLTTFNVLSPFAYTIDAESFADAAKRFVSLQRRLDITKLILADRFKTMKADIAYTQRNGEWVAGINLSPTVYPSYPGYPAVVTTNPNTPYPVGVASTMLSPLGLPDPLRPSALVKTTSQGQQVFPVTQNNIGVAGVNATPVTTIGVNPLGLGYTPTLAHGPYGPSYGPSMFSELGLNKKSKE